MRPLMAMPRPSRSVGQAFQPDSCCQPGKADLRPLSEIQAPCIFPRSRAKSVQREGAYDDDICGSGIEPKALYPM